ncbi:MAG TPA: PqqD family peptide modification chaperone [Thermoanaerobaculia bacterium]|nr:PqqD family peptide modification chaperone [Thermoanaerobaculia bacterium]
MNPAPLTVDPRTRLTPTTRVIEQKVAGSRVLLDPDNGRHYALDELSGRIWDLSARGLSVGELIAALQDELEERDVRRELGEMMAEKLLLVAEAPDESAA